MRKSELSTHTFAYTRIQAAAHLKSDSNTPEPDRPQHDRPAACVIAQQHSSTAFVSLRFGSSKEKLGARIKILLLKSFLTFLNVA
jgi:hypothetical protein